MSIYTVQVCSTHTLKSPAPSHADRTGIWHLPVDDGGALERVLLVSGNLMLTFAQDGLRCGRFCGKIEKLDYSPSAQSATVHFEKPSAAKTALMLNGGNLDGVSLTVTSEREHPDEPQNAHHDGHIEQSDKPRAASDYRDRYLLARGYLIDASQLRPNTLPEATLSLTMSSSARSSSTTSTASLRASSTTSNRLIQP